MEKAVCRTLPPSASVMAKFEFPTLLIKLDESVETRISRHEVNNRSVNEIESSHYFSKIWEPPVERNKKIMKFPAESFLST